MTILFESDDRNLTDAGLLVRGLAVLVVLVATAAAMIARSEGVFTRTVEVTAVLSDVGDGLPGRSDVKYRGVLVGSVREVEPAAGDGTAIVHIDLLPGHATGIPVTVTARVVPSNVFAVPSVQLVDNGPGPALTPGARIPQDRSRAGVQLQTALTALNRLAAAVGRPGSDPTVGILETLERATRGRGQDALTAAAQLERLMHAYQAEATAPGRAPLLTTLSEAVNGLQRSAPDLLATLHEAVVPLRSVTEQRAQLAAMLTGTLTTTGTVGAALTDRGDTLLALTARMGPVLQILAAGSDNFVQMTTSQTRVAHAFTQEFWNATDQSGTAKVIVELTPHQQYTRTDCPRYGELAGASCVTGPPAGPSVLDSLAVPVSGPEQQRRLAERLGLPAGNGGLAELLGLAAAVPEPGPVPNPGAPR
ncbi:MlaD family protein [Nocardia asiatica]|uniref:MlaD family protein n=1 Tax=Nocardia asiatica TaxID=209252 RepID=UPI003EDF693C